MGKGVDDLIAHMGKEDCYDLPHQDLYNLQVSAMNERFQEQKSTIKLVAHRAQEGDISEIRRLEDAVPLLLPHTAYKSYPERFLTEKRYDRLTKWLGTVSSLPTDAVNLDGINDMDEWVARCEDAGVLVSCSSGTTGKPAMLAASRADLDFAARDGIAAVQWGSDIREGDLRSPAGFGVVAYTPRNAAMGVAMMGAFVDTSKPRVDIGIPPLTIGSITGMVSLRKAIADGTAKPDEIAAFEEESVRRQQALDNGRHLAADDVIAKRADKLYLTGMWANLHQLAVEVRNRGYSGKDFHSENAVFLGGGLKRAELPADFKEFVYETFNLQPRFIYQMYGMQELNSSFPRCQKGQRYHLPPWVVCLPLNKNGDELLAVGEGKVEGRAAFFDLSMEGRWGGVISGDHIEVDFSPCACGSGSPSITDNIVRYSDLEGDDKIGCAGTVDAYVRGVS